MTKRYLVMDFKKIKTKTQFLNYMGHNTRERDYNSKNVKKELSHLNIVIEDSKIRTQEQLREITKTKMKKGSRQIKEDAAHAFFIVIDSSKNALSNEKNIEYLKDAHKWLKERFKGQLCLNSTIHCDEGKPHLHIGFSYFNEEKGKWNQKEMYQSGLTDMNNLLRDFENDVGKKYKLEKGKESELIEIEKEEITPPKAYKLKYVVNEGLLSNDYATGQFITKNESDKLIEKIQNLQNEKEQLERELIKSKKQNKELYEHLEKGFFGDEKELNNIINTVTNLEKEQEKLKFITKLLKSKQEEYEEYNQLVNNKNIEYKNLEKQQEQLPNEIKKNIEKLSLEEKNTQDRVNVLKQEKTLLKGQISVLNEEKNDIEKSKLDNPFLNMGKKLLEIREEIKKEIKYQTYNENKYTKEIQELIKQDTHIQKLLQNKNIEIEEVGIIRRK